MNRLDEILYNPKEFLKDEEIVIYVKGEEMIARYHDGEELSEVSGNVAYSLKQFLRWLKDENQY